MLIYTLPLIGALIGWVTNYVAVKMLFHPKTERRFLFIKLHGVFPKRQRAFAEKLGDLVSRELFSVEDVKQKMEEAAGRPKVRMVVEEVIEKVITEKLPAAIPMLGMFMSQELIVKVKGVLVDNIQGLVHVVVEALGEDLKELLNVRDVVEEKVSSFSSDKLEEIVFSIMQKEFKFIELIGAVLGFLVGLVQVAILQLEYLV